MRGSLSGARAPRRLRLAVVWALALALVLVGPLWATAEQVRHLENPDWRGLAEEIQVAINHSGGDPTEYSLDDMRAALFWWQRVVRWSWTEVPDEGTLAHCRRLNECIRRRLEDQSGG